MMTPYKGWKKRRMTTAFLLHQTLHLPPPPNYKENSDCHLKYKKDKFGIVDRLIYYYSEGFGNGSRSGRKKYIYVPLWSVKAYEKYHEMNASYKKSKWQ
ncbi:hypothetical protein [Inquilinus sp. CAU 1745]|uniref:hypothetical protein n=1 Tax=Inquilinus sp. CAU 1745 TaxID=3140369 RepID=UPI00325B9B2B